MSKSEDDTPNKTSDNEANVTTIYLHIHGTSGFTNADASASKFLAGTFLPKVFTKSTKCELLPIEEAPLNIKENFRPLYSDPDHPTQYQYYYQWSGKLGEDAWDEANDALYEEISPLLEDISTPLRFIITAHSHGGQIARLFSTKLQQVTPASQVHLITIATPLSITATYDPMPSNVKTWLACYHERDAVQAGGSLLMQKGQSIQIARGPSALPTYAKLTRVEDNSWLECAFNFLHIDPHNALLNAKWTAIICDQAKQQWHSSIEESNSLNP